MSQFPPNYFTPEYQAWKQAYGEWLRGGGVGPQPPDLYPPQPSPGEWRSPREWNPQSETPQQPPLLRHEIDYGTDLKSPAREKASSKGIPWTPGSSETDLPLFTNPPDPFGRDYTSWLVDPNRSHRGLPPWALDKKPEPAGTPMVQLGPADGGLGPSHMGMTNRQKGIRSSILGPMAHFSKYLSQGNNY